MDNMSDVINKFSSILKDKNIDLGKILGDEPESNPLDFDFDLDTIIKFKKIFNQINSSNSPRNNLLYSLKPFLREEKKQKLDQYIRIANLLSVLELINKNDSRKLIFLKGRYRYAKYVISG